MIKKLFCNKLKRCKKIYVQNHINLTRNDYSFRDKKKSNRYLVLYTFRVIHYIKLHFTVKRKSRSSSKSL